MSAFPHLISKCVLFILLYFFCGFYDLFIQFCTIICCACGEDFCTAPGDSIPRRALVRNILFSVLCQFCVILNLFLRGHVYKRGLRGMAIRAAMHQSAWRGTFIFMSPTPAPSGWLLPEITRVYYAEICVTRWRGVAMKEEYALVSIPIWYLNSLSVPNVKRSNSKVRHLTERKKNRHTQLIKVCGFPHLSYDDHLLHQ